MQRPSGSPTSHLHITPNPLGHEFGTNPDTLDPNLRTFVLASSRTYFQVSYIFPGSFDALVVG